MPAPGIQKVKTEDVFENPAYREIFGMDGVTEMCKDILHTKKVPTTKVFRLPKGGYEAYSDHKALLAAKELCMESIPVTARSLPDDAEKVRLFLKSNFDGRQTTMQVARGISYFFSFYAEGGKKKPLSALKEECGEIFHLTPISIDKYRHLPELIAPLQDMINEGKVSYTGLASAYRLTPANQEYLYGLLKEYIDTGGSVTRDFIFEKVQSLLKVQGDSIAMSAKQATVEQNVSDFADGESPASDNAGKFLSSARITLTDLIAVPDSSINRETYLLTKKTLEEKKAFEDKYLPLVQYFENVGLLPLPPEDVEPALKKIRDLLDTMHGHEMSKTEVSYLYDIVFRALTLAGFEKPIKGGTK